eukprot:TRINITY_DN30255_c0_g1_i1.p1 TRINITY_DN30255_c0_g1~~TRINITY_DN30255_c0_g1_i1.p1  ORF type:complete len:887 (-),score=143.13 TRINITY_DN30255_c0_g1_i1:223-2883(-)
MSSVNEAETATIYGTEKAEGGGRTQKGRSHSPPSTKSGSPSRSSTPPARSQTPPLAQAGTGMMDSGGSDTHAEISFKPDGTKVKDEIQRFTEEEEVCLRELPWFVAESNYEEQQALARRNFQAICAAVDELHRSGQCPSGRWVNDPTLFPDLNLGVVPFPPNNDQLFCPRMPPPPPAPPPPKYYVSPKKKTEDMGFKKADELVHPVENPFLTNCDAEDVRLNPFLTLADPKKDTLNKPRVDSSTAYAIGTDSGYGNYARGLRGASATGSGFEFGNYDSVKYSGDTSKEDAEELPPGWKWDYNEEHQCRVYWFEHDDGGVSEPQVERPPMPLPQRPHLLSELSPMSEADPMDPLWRPWVRMVDFASCGGRNGVCRIFPDDKDMGPRRNNHVATHMGRVFQGQLENAYLVEALNAISCRPALVKQLFHCWDVDRSVYVLQFHKNGTWMRVEIDDYMPAQTSTDPELEEAPFACRSEFFPWVLWPSLVEKAYAKACTLRSDTPGMCKGGWEAIGNAGSVEEALMDLTGGVAGSFSLNDVSPDRVFIYFYTLQRDCLFTARVNMLRCARLGIPFNPTVPYIVNRADYHESGCYVQIFCPHSSFGDSGLAEVTPTEVVRKHPELIKDGFYWLSIEDFCQCFATIFECRLTNSADVGIMTMPPSRLPNSLVTGPGPCGQPVPGAPLFTGGGGQTWKPPGFQPMFFERVWANHGQITEHNQPEFQLVLPCRPCEIVACVDQTDRRIVQVGATREDYTSILMKVYQNLQGGIYSADMVAKSEWIPQRNSMVSFKASYGGIFKIVIEVPHGCSVERLIFRCYSSVAGVEVFPAPNPYMYQLVERHVPPNATKWTMVGCTPPDRMSLVGMPIPLPEARSDLDVIRRRLSSEGCSVM